MKGKIWKYTVRILLILLAFFGAGAFLGLRTLTFVNPWIVAVASVVTAFIPARFLAARCPEVIALKNYPLRIAVWTVLLASVVTGTFYSVNYCGADEDDSVKVAAVVERKYHETRQRTRRVGRGRYVPTGETYNVYYADIRLSDGHLVTVPLTGNKVVQVRKGVALELDVTPGALGVPVVISRNIFKNSK